MSLNQDQRAYRATEWYKENHRRWEKEYSRRFPEKALLRSCRKRASRNKIEFNIDESDIIIPDICPILLTPIKYGSDNRSEWPSVDKVNPLKGYTKGNITVISYHANRMKSNMSIDDVRRMLALMEAFNG
jgi:hypothetical protein